jgi:DNA-binding MarR family transcriptional regulator
MPGRDLSAWLPDRWKRDQETRRAYILTPKPKDKRCALRVIAALDRLQKEFEGEIGKTTLAEMLRSIPRSGSVGS